LIPQLEVDWKLVRESAPFVFDCANALGVKREGIVRL
jgi:hypothetical protein